MKEQNREKVYLNPKYRPRNQANKNYHYLSNQSAQNFNLKCKNSTNRFASLLKKQQFNNQHQQSNREILNCFNNISAVIQQIDEPKDNQFLKCKKIINASDEESQLPKFSSIQESLSSSPDKTLLRDHIMLNQIYHSNNCQRYQQYSFNGDKSDQLNRSVKKYPQINTKTKYLNLLQKIDHFLVKDFAIEDQKNKIQKQMSSQGKLSQRKKNVIGRQSDRQFQCLNLQNRENEYFEESNLSVLNNYIRHLQNQNNNLRNQKQQLLANQKKLKEIEKLIQQKNIIIQYLSKQLKKKQANQQQSIAFPKDLDQNKRQITQKQRNTISGAYNIQKKANIQKKRASEYVDIDKLNHQQKQTRQKFDNFSGSSYPSRNKSISFMRKIFRKSQQDQKNVNQKSQLNSDPAEYNSQIIQLLKQQNQILSTKLNILYGDFQQIIDKYNQVLTQKSICKQICCRNVQKQYQNQYFRENQVPQNHLKSKANNSYGSKQKYSQKLDPFEMEINRIIYSLKHKQNQPNFINDCQNNHNQKNFQLNDSLFTNQQLQNLKYNHDVKLAQINQSYPHQHNQVYPDQNHFQYQYQYLPYQNQYHTDRPMNNYYYKDTNNNSNLAKMSLNREEFLKNLNKSKRVSNVFTEKQNIQRQNIQYPQQSKFKKVKKQQYYENQSQKNDKRQKIAPKQSNRSIKKVNSVQYLFVNQSSGLQ